MGVEMKELSVEPHDYAEGRIAQTSGAPGNGIEDRLHVRGRARDDPEDLAGGGLLLEGFGEVAVPGLELLEQADVLDGNDSLVGERLHEIDLLIGERLDFTPYHYEDSKEGTLPEHRDTQHASKAAYLLSLRQLEFGIP